MESKNIPSRLRTFATGSPVNNSMPSRFARTQLPSSLLFGTPTWPPCSLSVVSLGIG